MDHQIQVAPEKPTVTRCLRDDGTILVRSTRTLPPIARSIPGRLAYWALQTPTATFLSEGKRELTYGAAEAIRRQWAARLLTAPVSAEKPLMILAANGIEHAIVMLAATSIGVPVAVVGPAYATAAGRAPAKLQGVLARIDPGLIVADNVGAVKAAVAGAGQGVPVRSLKDLSWLDAADPVNDAALDAAECEVGPDTIAKLLLTSGSTGMPKGVINTQRMMVSNMQALSLLWPFLDARPPVLVDWLPWNHTFGGNFCFNIALWFGGHFHIDHGRPSPGPFHDTIMAIRQHRPTIYFNVPAGFEQLVPLLEADREFANNFLANLDFLFSAGAPMPPSLRWRLEAAARVATGRMPAIFGGWGATETAPFATVLDFQTFHSVNLGVPVPGTIVKLVPDDDRYELRVFGPNVTPGYWHDAPATTAAFDDEGFFRIGDAGRLADPNDPTAGILFDGRMAENFKLSSGTFVNVGGIRVAVVSAGDKLILDVVVAGEGERDIGLLIFPNEGACRDFLVRSGDDEGVGALASTHPVIVAHITALLRSYNAALSGSSMRVRRFLVTPEPPSADHGEINEKGYINQRRVLIRRKALVEEMFQQGIRL